MIHRSKRDSREIPEILPRPRRKGERAKEDEEEGKRKKKKKRKEEEKSCFGDRGSA